MKILHVITSLQRAAGTSVFVAELSNELVGVGHQVTIATATPGAKDVCLLDRRINCIGYESIWNSSFDVAHIHALWSPVLHKVSKWAHKNSIPVVWSPHGMLQKWALKNKWWKKLPALALYQWRDLHAAELLHATADSEIEDIRRLGLNNKIVNAPLGVRSDKIAVVYDEHNEQPDKILLFVSRVQKKKGLPVLVDAWARISTDLKAGWRVRIVGPDQDNHTSELMARCKKRGVANDFVFVGPKYGMELDAEYRGADLFVLPTHSENFGSVVIEALARGVPVICSKGAPWKDLEEYKCGWWPEDSVGGLASAIESALRMSAAERRQMGARGVDLIARKYSWCSVANKMIANYSSIITKCK